MRGEYSIALGALRLTPAVGLGALRFRFLIRSAAGLSFAARHPRACNTGGPYKTGAKHEKTSFTRRGGAPPIDFTTRPRHVFVHSFITLYRYQEFRGSVFLSLSD